jgi:hypothetical protein
VDSCVIFCRTCGTHLLRNCAPVCLPLFRFPSRVLLTQLDCSNAELCWQFLIWMLGKQRAGRAVCQFVRAVATVAADRTSCALRQKKGKSVALDFFSLRRQAEGVWQSCYLFWTLASGITLLRLHYVHQGCSSACSFRMSRIPVSTS